MTNHKPSFCRKYELPKRELQFRGRKCRLCVVLLLAQIFSFSYQSPVAVTYYWSIMSQIVDLTSDKYSNSFWNKCSRCLHLNRLGKGESFTFHIIICLKTKRHRTIINHTIHTRLCKCSFSLLSCTK